MANSNMELLNPEFWGAFDEVDQGQYPLRNLVNRKYENLLAKTGDTVNVPVAEEMTATVYTPGETLTATNLTQATKQVILNKSYRKTLEFNDAENSLNPYDLIETYAIPAIESLAYQVETDIYKEMLKGQYFTDGMTTFNEDTVVDAFTALSNRKIQVPNRKLVLAPGDSGSLKKVDPYQFVNQSGERDVMINGMITKRMGFDFYESNGIATYTPVDLVGAVNLLAGYAIGTTTIAVDGFNDDVTPIRAGDIFKITGDTTPYTVLSTTTTTSDTTGLTFYPPLVAAVLDDAVVTVTPTRSVLAFVPNVLAFAARPYAAIPEGLGVKSRVMNMSGLPIRISVWHSGNLGIKVQYDCLYGQTLVDQRRLQRIIID